MRLAAIDEHIRSWYAIFVPTSTARFSLLYSAVDLLQRDPRSCTPLEWVVFSCFQSCITPNGWIEEQIGEAKFA